MNERRATTSPVGNDGDRARRRFVAGMLGLAGGSLAATALRAQPPRDAAPPDPSVVAAQLPLEGVVGLEHVGTVVPNVTEAAQFFGRVFNTFVYKEKAPPLRYYVTLDPGYIAIGSREGADEAFIDHDCVYAEGFDRAAMAERLRQEKLPTGRFGIFPDPDGLGMQLLPIGGLAGTTVPAGHIVDGAPLVRPRGLYRVVRKVADVDRSAAFYRRFLGRETTDVPASERSVDAVWFRAGPTWLGLEAAGRDEAPRIDRFCVNVAGGEFDPDALTQALPALGALVVAASGDELFGFRSPDGIGVELRPVDPARAWGRA